MGSYQVDFSKKASKELSRIDSRYIPKIVKAVGMLADDPHPRGSKKLSGAEDTYRIRVGDYRVIYEIEEERLVILILRVRHRQSAYD